MSVITAKVEEHHTLRAQVSDQGNISEEALMATATQTSTQGRRIHASLPSSDERHTHLQVDQWILSWNSAGVTDLSGFSQLDYMALLADPGVLTDGILAMLATLPSLTTLVLDELNVAYIGNRLQCMHEHTSEDVNLITNSLFPYRGSRGQALAHSKVKH
ncbi:MAG: hypothetical protein AAGI44_04360 [Pseudomonadota bacterium]